MTRITPVLVAVIAFGLAASAHAQTPNKKAKGEATKLVRQAAQLYQDGDRVAAVTKFENAYKIYPSAAILYNLGTAYAGVGRNALAHRTLSKFMRVAKKLSAKRTAAVRRTLRNLEGIVGRLSVSVDTAGVRVLVDGSFVGLSPIADPIAVSNGVHLVSIEKAGKPLGRQTVAAGTGALVQVKFIVTTAKKPAVATEVGNKSIAKPGKGVPSPKEAAKRVGDPDPLTVTNNATSKPLLAKWWFWTAVGAVVLAGTAVALGSGGSTVNSVSPTLGQFDFGQF